MTKSPKSQLPAALYEGDERKVSFHSMIHGGEYACIGIYENEDFSVFDANQKAVAFIASMVKIDNSTRILDIGAGYGGAAHYLAKTFGCKVTCLNINPEQNDVNQRKVNFLGLTQQVSVITGSYENIEGLVEENSFDIVWSQDAMFFSRFPELIFKGVKYALKPGGQFIFSDLMRQEHCSSELLASILSVQKIDSLCSADDYQSIATSNDFKELRLIEMPEQLVRHYSHVVESIDHNYSELVKKCGEDFVKYHRERVSMWIEGTKSGSFNWGVLHFQLV
jgi:sarcosine/dimethylglycine N-methyltransferase